MIFCEAITVVEDYISGLGERSLLQNSNEKLMQEVEFDYV